MLDSQVEFEYVLLYTGSTMDEIEGKREKRAPRKRSFFRVVLRTSGALVRFLYDKAREDIALLLTNGRLFVGLAFLMTGLLSFTPDRYCDGNSSSYYACTRPSTYYYYEWWAIALVLVGSFFIVLWFLRRGK